MVTFTGQTGFGRGSRWAAVGVSWETQDGWFTDASGFQTVTFRLASNARSLRVAIIGFDLLVRRANCFPERSVEVTEELKEYTLPLSSFAPPEGCADKARQMAETLPKLTGFQAMALTPARGESIVIAVGSTTLRR